MYQEKFTVSFNHGTPTEKGLVLVFLNGLLQEEGSLADYSLAPERKAIRWHRILKNRDKVISVFETDMGWKRETLEIDC